MLADRVILFRLATSTQLERAALLAHNAPPHAKHFARRSSPRSRHAHRGNNLRRRS